MIPQTFPSKAAGSDGGAVMQAKFLTSVTGLVRWTDYIPVKLKTGGVQDSTDNNGFISIEQAVLTASSKAFVDYYPVYVDNAATKAWECSADGYIPYAPHNTAGCSLVLDFTNGAALDSRITFTRTTGASNPATYVNSSGVITAATNNQPRFDYDPMTLACKGLLIEESRANICVYSEQIDQWSNSGAGVTTNAIAAPDGNTTADLVTRTSGAGDSRYRGITFTGDGVKTTSMWIKKSDSPASLIALYDATSTTYKLWVDVTWSGNTPILAFTNGSLQKSTEYPNNWWRLEFITESVVAANTFRYYVYPGRTGSSNGQGLYCWGAQVENGTFATSYIPTTTAALTRNADVATMTGTNFSSWYNASEGTLEAKAQTYALGATRSMVSISDGTANNILELRLVALTGTDNSRFLGVTSGSVVFNLTTAATTVANTQYNFIGAYKQNNFAAARDSVFVGSDLSGNVPVVNKLLIGASATGSSLLNGTISKITYYSQRLTNSELQAFSKG